MVDCEVAVVDFDEAGAVVLSVELEEPQAASVIATRNESDTTAALPRRLLATGKQLFE